MPSPREHSSVGIGFLLCQASQGRRPGINTHNLSHSVCLQHLCSQGLGWGRQVMHNLRRGSLSGTPCALALALTAGASLNPAPGSRIPASLYPCPRAPPGLRPTDHLPLSVPSFHLTQSHRCSAFWGPVGYGRFSKPPSSLLGSFRFPGREAFVLRVQAASSMLTAALWGFFGEIRPGRPHP